MILQRFAEPGQRKALAFTILVHAGLIDFLARAPAKVIVYDVIFTERDRRSFKIGDEEWTGEESDRALAESVAQSRRSFELANELYTKGVGEFLNVLVAQCALFESQEARDLAAIL